MRVPCSIYKSFVLGAALVATGATWAETADHVFTNAKVYTVDESRPWAEAFVIKDGKFVAVGSNEEINAKIGENTQKVDLARGDLRSGVHLLTEHTLVGWRLVRTIFREF